MKKNILMKKVFAIGTSVAMFTCVFAFGGLNVANAAGPAEAPAATVAQAPDLNKMKTVPITLVKDGTVDKPSMAAKAAEPLARFEEKDGRIEVYLSFKPLKVGTLTASVQVLKVKQPDGSLKEAEIVARKDGKPSTFHITMEKKNQFADITVNVKDGPMGDNDIPVRVKFDWSKEGGPVPMQPEKKEPSGNVDKNKDGNKNKAGKDNDMIADNNQSEDKGTERPMSPKTADDSSVGLFAALGLGSLAVGASIRRREKRR